MSRRGGTHKFLPVLVLLALVVFVTIKAPHVHQSTTENAGGNLPTASAPAGSLSLITEPAAGVTPVLNLINTAKHSVDLVMYELEDPGIEQALVTAQSRGVKVRVLLNGGYYGKPEAIQPNQTAYNYLQNHHVPVHWTPKYFALTHQKTLVIDGSTG